MKNTKISDYVLIHLIPRIGMPWLRKVNGAENLPKEKIGMIIACNHSSYLDHFIFGGTIMYKLKQAVLFLAKKEHFEGSQKKWHEFLQAVPIDRQSGGKKALRFAVKALKEKKVIAIYPEGTRTLNGKLNPAKTGIARLALAAKVPVLPVGLTNTFKILPKGKLLPKFEKTDMSIGKLMYFNKYYNKAEDYKTLKKISNDIMKEIAKLAKKKYNY